MLLPQLTAFQPDLLFISAGFDAHYDDFYHYLTEHDIHWITERMVDIVQSSGGKGVISILEGGYSLKAAVATEKALGKTRGGTSKSSSALSTMAAADVKPALSTPQTMFAQQPGDGGLVKG